MLNRLVGRVDNWLRVSGIDCRRFLKVMKYLPRYVISLGVFHSKANKKRSERKYSILPLPVLGDYDCESGDMSSEYFLADLYTAQQVFAINEKIRVLDIGSRTDGLVAHIAAFRKVYVLDIRKNKSSCIDNIVFKQGDATAVGGIRLDDGKFGCVTCIHALEHFGLGRYGDRLDIDAPAKALANIAGATSGGGVVYLGVPTGKERVLFNSHRVFDPIDIVMKCKSVGLSLESFTEIRPDGLFFSTEMSRLRECGEESYTFIVFRLRRDS